MKPEWVPFSYREFYDVPRCIAVEYGRRLLFLFSPFNRELDEYESSYTVYELQQEQSLAELASRASWVDLPGPSSKIVGRLPVGEMRFDSSRRKTLDLGVLQGLDFSG